METSNEEATLSSQLQNLSIKYYIQEEAGTQILTLAAFIERLPTLCSSISKTLGTRQLEKTYQNALKIDLEKHGVEVIDEQSIKILIR